MLRVLANGVCLAALMLGTQAARAAEAEQCKAVRMAEPGWNDLAFTTGVAYVLL
ncbi:MAG: glycine/betaine ABC transporter substrate-binding protein, partial [Mesorhizobium sp.]